ncbi:hypothetical protein [Lutibacter maritimus]|uniref:Uncharacterized protein n=1 Tax=Lutibacter maritimus TaxID=593133 RepID=A0A1I6REB8_9FLAO|nr:hypothetical protein [Lutibacter maritimus]SFS63081.1 hypothetical protein SAMN04488006_2390 [Lutibacter maritimus]
MKLTSRIVLTFNDIFPDEEPKGINEYLDGIDKDLLIKFGSFILGFSRDSKYEHPVTFLKMFFSEENDQFSREVFLKLRAFVGVSDKPITDYSFPFIVSSLSFFENAFAENFGLLKNYTNQEIEIRIFKAYLLLNKINTTNRTFVLDESISYLKEDITKFATGYCIGLFLNSSDFVNYDLKKVFVTQIIRAISFFEFLEGIDSAQELLKEFYKEYNVSGYSAYLKGLLPLATSVITNEKESHTDIIITENKKKASNIEFLEKFSIDPSELFEAFDFNYMRSAPVYRYDENTFRLTYPLFALELIGNGLYFKFKAINDELPKGKKVKDLYGLKTYDFSEKFILHKVLKDYFGNRFFQRNGDDLDAEFEGAPDYYVRNGKKIFLFESKDILLNAKVKQSSDFNEINNELSIKLYKNEKGKQKAVLQIINNIRKILTKTLEFDSKYNPRNIIIHPILVLHYRIFNTTALNKWVNFWFQEELKNLEQEGLDVSNVKPLLLIDIDTLIYNKDVFSGCKLSLEEVLIEYQEDFINFSVKDKKYRSEEEATQALKNSLIPFGEFLDNKIDLSGLRVVPKEFEEKTYGLFKD